MLLFRSEADIDAWANETGNPRGEAVRLATVWELSKVWYGDRLSPEYRGRTPEQVQAIFDSFGLTSAHWKVAR
jgi:hypothetical protein